MKLASFKTISILAVAIVIVVGAASFYRGSLSAGPRPETLSPALFNDDAKAMAAYQVAKDIPEVLDQLPCFCGCDMHFGHKNNLYCFSDMHGSACDMCEDIALMASDLHKKGYSVEKIKQAVTERFSSSSN